MYSFAVGKNWLYARNPITIELFHQPNMHVVIAFIHHYPLVWICQYIQCTDPLWLQRLMLQDILRRVSDTLGLWFLHSTLSLVLMGIHNLVTSAIWIEVIVFTLFIHVIYLCYKSSSTVFVSIPIQGWHLSTETWSIRVGSLQDGIRAHVDCRTWP